jgi:hypothetical protein
MKLQILLALTGAFTLCQCSTPEASGDGNFPRKYNFKDVGDASEDARIRRDLGPDHSDYQPKVAKAYRGGYSAGRTDRLEGLPLDPQRSLMSWGGDGDYESFFRDGYFDGFLNNGMRH